MATKQESLFLWFLFYYLKIMSRKYKDLLLGKLLHIYFLEENEEIKKKLEDAIELLAFKF